MNCNVIKFIILSIIMWTPTICYGQVTDPFDGIEEQSPPSTNYILITAIKDSAVQKHFGIYNSRDTLYIIDCNSFIRKFNYTLKSCDREVKIIRNTTLDLDRYIYTDDPVEEGWRNHIQITNLFYCNDTWRLELFCKYRNLGGFLDFGLVDNKFVIKNKTLVVY